MSSLAVEPRSWTRRRWWTMVAVLVAVQMALVLWLGDKTPVHPRQATSEPKILWWPGYTDELTALHDPTLFVWANPHGFSETAWLEVPPLEYQPFEWTEPPQFLAVRVERLGQAFRQVVQGSSAPRFETTGKPEAQITVPELEAGTTSIPAQSSLRIEGNLAGRRLLSRFDLPSWRTNDILRASVVQVVVGADGQTQSAALLSSSGLKEADARALDLAKSAEWEPLQRPGQHRSARGVAPLRWGQLAFSWHTMPLPATNSPPANP